MQHPSVFLRFPSWYREIVDHTTREERRKLSYMWLSLPLRTRLLYNAQHARVSQLGGVGRAFSSMMDTSDCKARVAQSQHKAAHNNCEPCAKSGRPGLEPGMADPESAVLPIKLSPT